MLEQIERRACLSALPTDQVHPASGQRSGSSPLKTSDRCRDLNCQKLVSLESMAQTGYSEYRMRHLRREMGKGGRHFQFFSLQGCDGFRRPLTRPRLCGLQFVSKLQQHRLLPVFRREMAANGQSILADVKRNRHTRQSEHILW